MYTHTEQIAMIITTFSMIVKEMHVNSSIDVTMIITVKICPVMQFSQP